MKKTLLEICNAEWSIIEATGRTIRRHTDELVDGLTDYDTQTIYIRSDIHPHRKHLALAHEWYHVIIDHQGLQFPISNEEILIRGSEHPLLEMVFKLYGYIRDDGGVK